MADVLHINDALAIPLEEAQLRASRSSGPGGQHANATASRIEASFDVAASRTLSEVQKARIAARCGAVVRAISQDARSQARNRTLALERLAARIARALEAPRTRRPTRPTAASQRSRLDAKPPRRGAQARAPTSGRRGVRR